MIKKLGLTTAMGALLLSGCGGGSDTKSITEQIAERDGVMIIHDANLAFCETLKNILEEDPIAKDVISDNPANTVSCNTYNKQDGDIDDPAAECVNTNLAYFADDTITDDISIYEDTTKACVIGANEVQ